MTDFSESAKNFQFIQTQFGSKYQNTNSSGVSCPEWLNFPKKMLILVITFSDFGTVKKHVPKQF